MIGCLGINFFGQHLKKPSRVQRKRAGKKVLIRGHAAMCYLLCCVVPGSFPDKRFFKITLYKSFLKSKPFDLLMASDHTLI